MFSLHEKKNYNDCSSIRSTIRFFDNLFVGFFFKLKTKYFRRVGTPSNTVVGLSIDSKIMLSNFTLSNP